MAVWKGHKHPLELLAVLSGLSRLTSYITQLLSSWKGLFCISYSVLFYVF